MASASEAKKPVTLPERMVLAAFGGMGAATFCHPIDTIRINMQIRQYAGGIDAVRNIIKPGIIRGLYPGVDAAFLRQWTYGSCRMGLFQFMAQRYKSTVAPDIPFLAKMGMGCVAGGIGSFVGNPCELAMVRLSADGKKPVEERRHYKNVFDCMFRVAKEEGVVSLWNGATPTVLRAMVLSSTVLTTYSEAKLMLVRSAPTIFPNTDTIPCQFVGTTMAAFVANMFCVPFDVIKSRVQDGNQYKGMVDCVRKSVAAEGPMVLYKGYVPALVKLAPYTTLSLMLTEKFTALWTGEKGGF